MDTSVRISFGTLLLHLFQGLFTARSWDSFICLAWGWTLARDRHTITTYLWLTGATTLKHFSRFYGFLGGPLYQQRWHLWGAIIRLAAQLVPEDQVLQVVFDDMTKKKAGTHIQGLARYRNGAGSARQEYRTLRGLNFVLGIMRLPLKPWPGHYLSIPVGLELYLKPEQAHQLQVPYRSRSQLARDILDFVAHQLSGRQLRSLADGGYATKEYLRQLPDTVQAVGRFPVSGQLYQLPPKLEQKRRGAPRKKGDLLGSPKTLAQTPSGWWPHPTEAGTQVQAWCGLWHSVLPGRLIQVVVIRRDAQRASRKPGSRKPPPPVEAFFSTDLALSPQAILGEYRNRWAVEIEIRDANGFDGLGQDQCRKWQRISGANTFRLVLAATRTLWFIQQVEGSAPINLRRYRPWYRQKVAPSQRDVVWACREALQLAGVFPIPRFTLDLVENQEEHQHALPIMA